LDTPNVYLERIRRFEHHFTIQEWFEIKVCAKCGKANNVTRRYCAGCGASLIKKVEEVDPEPIEEAVEEPIPGSPEYKEEEPHVLPSEVASEQDEVESEEPETNEAIAEAPVSEDVSVDDKEEVPEATPMDSDRGKEVVADILEKVKAAEARSRGEEATTPSETDLEPPPEESFEEIEEPMAYEEPEVEVEEEEPYVEEEPEAPETGFVALEKPSEAAPTSPPVYMAADEPVRDEKVRTFESEISAGLIERDQLQSELDQLRTRLDEEVGRYHTAAEVKRTRAESIERDLKLAKKEHSDASKEFKNAENRRKKELSNSEKRIRDIEKRIKKARESKEKRLQDIEKERRKREEEAKRN